MERKLRAAIKRKLSKDELSKIAEFGADRGFPGFTTPLETVPFYKKYRPEIVKLVEQAAREIDKSPVEFVKGFRLLNTTSLSVASTLYGSMIDEQVANALTWFALETIAIRG